MKTYRGNAMGAYVAIIGLALASVAFLVLAFSQGITAQILTSLQTGMAAGSVAQNVTNNSLSGLNSMASQNGSLGLVVMAGGIIGILLAVFGGLAYGMAKD